MLSWVAAVLLLFSCCRPSSLCLSHVRVIVLRVSYDCPRFLSLSHTSRRFVWLSQAFLRYEWSFPDYYMFMWISYDPHSLAPFPHSCRKSVWVLHGRPRFAAPSHSCDGGWGVWQCMKLLSVMCWRKQQTAAVRQLYISPCLGRRICCYYKGGFCVEVDDYLGCGGFRLLIGFPRSGIVCEWGFR